MLRNNVIKGHFVYIIISSASIIRIHAAAPLEASMGTWCGRGFNDMSNFDFSFKKEKNNISIIFPFWELFSFFREGEFKTT